MSSAASAPSFFPSLVPTFTPVPSLTPVPSTSFEPTSYPLNSAVPTSLPHAFFECSTALDLKDDDGADDGSASSADEWGALGLTCYLYAPLGLALLVLFELARSKRTVFAQRTSKMKHRSPPMPGKWPLQWLVPVLTIDDDEVRPAPSLL